MSDLPRLHSAAEVAEALGVSEDYVKRQCRQQVWPHRRLSRGRVGFTAEDYARVLELVAADVTAGPEPRISFAPRSRRAS